MPITPSNVKEKAGCQSRVGCSTARVAPRQRTVLYSLGYPV